MRTHTFTKSLVTGATALAVAVASGIAKPVFPDDLDDDRGQTDRVERLERELERQSRDLAVRRGTRIFARSCAVCHGNNGRGNGPGAADLDPAPRDLSTLQFRFRSTASGHPPLALDLERTIRRGLPGTAMPGYGDLFSEDEMMALTRFIESLRGPAADDAEPPQPVVIPELPAPTPKQIEKGRGVYLVLGCWRCHGVKGGGRGPSAPHLTDENDRRIRMPDFRYDPLKGGRDPVAVARTLITGLNGSPMPAYGDAMLLVRDESADLPPRKQLTLRDDDALARLNATLPTRSRMDSMDAEQRARQREERLASLVHYVLSLDRRRGAGYWLFHERPELEARRP